MRPIFGLLAVAALSTSALSPALAAGLVEHQTMASPVQPATDPASGLTVMSYNVEGLPWPLAPKRAAAADRIASRLEALRAQGQAPQVVMVQEAFGGPQRKIGALAGYPYIAYGPGRHFKGQAPGAADAPKLEGHGRFWHGEGVGKFENSGLAVFSDYPILWTRKVAFGSGACAGWDCLANKGALAVALAVPGVTGPVVVIDTHLNSSGAAHVSPQRAGAAFDAQMALLTGFVKSLLPSAGAVVLGGDFNIGQHPLRSQLFDSDLLAGAGLQVAAQEHVCGAGCREPDDGSGPDDTQVQTKSLLAWRDLNGQAIRPVGHVISFGKSADGHMLSDHVGIAMHFAVPA